MCTVLDGHLVKIYPLPKEDRHDCLAGSLHVSKISEICLFLLTERIRRSRMLRPDICKISLKCLHRQVSVPCEKDEMLISVL